MIRSVFIQSEYSLLKSIVKIKDLVHLTYHYGERQLFLCDDNLGGILEFISECKKVNIEGYVGLRTKVKFNDYIDEFIIIPKTKLGYRHLLEINYQQSLDSFVTSKEASSFASDLIFISSGIDSVIFQNLVNNNLDRAFELTKYYKSIFPSFYFGLSLQQYVNSLILKQYITKIKELSIYCLPAIKTLYLKPSEKETHAIYVKINNLDDQLHPDIDYSLLSEEQFNDLYSDYIVYLSDGTNNLLQNLYEYEVTFEPISLPKYCENPDIFLRDLCIVGLTKRLGVKRLDDIYYQRLLSELQVIDSMGFNDYFLITFDFIRFARKEGIMVGPGRGSSVGSLVAYSIGITNIDPIKYNLLFERFLNPLRLTMPDIDVDFEDGRRDEVIKYVISKYGANNVIQIGTFSRFGFRAAVRDIQRIEHLDEELVKRTIDRFEAGDVEKGDAPSMDLINKASKFIDLPRHTGTHASGIIIASENLFLRLPLVKSALGFQSQVEGSYLESIGLIKMDFLSLSNLTFIKDIIALIKNFNLDKISMNDTRTFELLSNGATDDVFQFESNGMKKVLRELKPTSILDVSAALALFRPGPMDNINNFIKAKNTKVSFNKIPILDGILSETYGIPIYQEQIMQIARTYAGFSLFEADVLRRAISKKNINQMISLKDDFIKKSKALGRDAIEANSVYNLIEKFAEYGFNKSHSIAYATLAYQMAYLKANYYLEFMCVKLNKNIAFSLEVSEAISSLIVNGVKILPPNLFYSLDYFYINQDRQLVIPLSYIRTIGKTQAKQLVELKKTVGVLTFENYIKSSVMFLTRENILNLINSCALDSFGITHYEMTKYLDGLSYYLYQQNHGEDNNEFDFKYLKEEEFKSVNHNFKYNNFHNNYDFSGYLTLEATLVAVNEIKTKKGFPMAFIRIDDNVISIEIVCFSSVYQNIKHLLIVNKNYKFKVRKNEGQTIELISIS